jgi:hypothetical protein
MAKRRTRPTVARLRQLETDNERLRAQLADVATIGVDTASGWRQQSQPFPPMSTPWRRWRARYATPTPT